MKNELESMIKWALLSTLSYVLLCLIPADIYYYILVATTFFWVELGVILFLTWYMILNISLHFFSLGAIYSVIKFVKKNPAKIQYVIIPLIFNAYVLGWLIIPFISLLIGHGWHPIVTKGMN